MTSLAPTKNLFEICDPRPDILAGSARDSDFAADLAQVLAKTAPSEYRDASVFFGNTHPTAGLRALLENVCRRLSGAGGEAASIFRLDTQYGGGKTHSLIALLHVAGGMAGVSHPEEFIPKELVPKGRVRIAAFDGENADPANGRVVAPGVRAFTPWGELAWALAGAEGYERVRTSDVERTAPGADTFRSLFGGEPTLILLDELSIYLRKVKGKRDAEQLAPFFNSLFKAVESSPGAAVVFTLAIGKEGRGFDAYSAENEALFRQLEEAASVAARKATLIDPTTESETAQVLRRRLFGRIDEARAKEVVDAYAELWNAHRSDLPSPRIDENRSAEFLRGYPLHPALMSTLTDKLSTLANFQRVRGMLRLLSQSVSRLWAERPAGTCALHLHHLDPGYGPTRNEIVTKLELASYDPAIRNDVSSHDGAASLAQQLDVTNYAGLAPYASYVARDVLWNSFAFNEHLKGIAADELRYAILGPGLDLGFINDARDKFIQQAAYLDDRPGASLRFLTEANLTMMIRRQEDQVDPGEVRTELNDRIRSIFAGDTFELVPFVADPADLPDESGRGRPFLALVAYEADAVRFDVLKVPPLVERCFRSAGSQGAFRQLQNNVLFLVADEGLRDAMKARVRRRLALEAMKLPERISQLAEHQQAKVLELYRRSEQEVALSIQQCYRHLFYPARAHRVEGATVDLAHAAFDVQSASERPGAGQVQVLRTLADASKAYTKDAQPPAPSWIRDQTPLKKGQISTAELRGEFRKDPRLPILLDDDVFRRLVRRGVEDSVYVYRSGDLLVGPGDPWADIRVDEESFVLTMTWAKEREIWPRKTAEPPTPPSSSSHFPEDSAGKKTNVSMPPPAVPYHARIFRSEKPLREALTNLWEDARAAKVPGIVSLSLRVFDRADAFKLLSALGSVSAFEKKVELRAEYETRQGGRLSLEFSGTPSDAAPVKEFLDPQFRAATDSDLTTHYTLRFDPQLDLSGKDPENLTEKLARFASGAAYVEAVAEGAK